MQPWEKFLPVVSHFFFWFKTMDTTFTPEELAALPHNSRGPALIGVSWALTGLATLFLALRIYCRHIGRRGLWWDDWTLIAAWVRGVVSLCQTFSASFKTVRIAKTRSWIAGGDCY